MRAMIAAVVLTVVVTPRAPARSIDEVPEALIPFEHMIGGWKGIAAPTANRVKGWPESHGWAWKFEKGVPVGISLTLEGDKSLSKGLLTFDPAAKKYHVDGTDPEGKSVAFIGAFSADGKTLTLDRIGATADGGKERLVVRPNSNKIRYTLQLDRQEKGSPQFKSIISVGLTKEGESFAAGGAEANLPRCILTGGAASMSVSYMGKSYPICCTGCRDEFNDNPEKYAKKAESMAQVTPSPASKADEAKESTAIKPPATKPDAPKVKDDSESRAGRELSLGQNFEKNGKKSIALEHYRKVVKDHPATEAARLAAARIKALGAR